MPVSRIRIGRSRTDYVVVERDAVMDNVSDAFDVTTLALSHTKRDDDNDDLDFSSDDDDDLLPSLTATTPVPSGSLAPLLVTMTITPSPVASQSTVDVLADTDPTETVVVSLQPSISQGTTDRSQDSGRISQTTEHLLIAAGSIGATIIIVMIVLALYTMRRRGLTFMDLFRQRKDQTMGRGPVPSTANANYDWDNKHRFDDDYGSMGNSSIYPPPAAMARDRNGSLSSQSTLRSLDRSDSFKRRELERTSAVNGIPKTFQLENPPIRKNSHRRENSATPSSPFLGIEGPRRSASTHNTRSMQYEDEYMQYPDSTRLQPPPGQPTPPSFKQFLSNRPSISQRPGLGGMASRFSWTNSQAPQTPQDPSRNTVQESLGGRESFLTDRSSVPRFRTINSWVNQQSNRIEERKLREQYRETQNFDFSDAGNDMVEMPPMPPMPPMPSDGSQPNSLTVNNIRHQRHETSTSVTTAPIFKQHPGTEVRFSRHSTVPSEILDMGRHTSVLR